MAVLATLIGCQGMEEYRLVLSRALDVGLAPIAVKEIVYQAVGYLGIGRVLPYLKASNSILESRGIELPLEGQCTTTSENRLENLAQREMITFCFLAAQGGCEPQLTSHAAANMRIGNDKGFLIRIISQCLPFIGYPRSLNALRCVNEAAKSGEEK